MKNTLQLIKNIETDDDTLRIIEYYEGKEEEIFQDIEYICFSFIFIIQATILIVINKRKWQNIGI